MGNFNLCFSAELDECLNTLLWPRRGHGGHFWLTDPWTGRFLTRAELFRLTPIWVPEEPPAKRAKKTTASAAGTQDAPMVRDETKGEKKSSDECDSDSSGSNSDFSSEDGSSETSDLDKFEKAYKEFSKLTAGVDAIAPDRIVSGNNTRLQTVN